MKQFSFIRSSLCYLSATSKHTSIPEVMSYQQTKLLAYPETALRMCSSSNEIRTGSFSPTIGRESNWVNSLETLSPTSDVDYQRQVSIFSWNILAQHLFDSTQKWYEYVDPAAPVFSWKDRFPLISKEIERSKADIICLQEVEFDAFDNDLLPFMNEGGYAGLMQNDKRRGSNHGYGLATFWKRDKFRITNEIHRSRAMITFLEEKEDSLDQKVLAVTNCHLQGSPTKSVTRVKQLQNILSDLRKQRHHNLLVCGDMNCMLNHSASSTYLQFGTCKDREILEWGRPVDNAIHHIKEHSYCMHSAYTVDLLEKYPMDYITFVSAPNCVTHALDQIWYHADPLDSVEVIGLKHPFRSQQHQRDVIKNGLPSKHNASDHLPIGCILQWKSGDEVDLRTRHRGYGRTKYNTKKMSQAELLEESSRLLKKVVFDSPKQKEEFIFIISHEDDIDKAEPTKDHIKLVRKRRSMKKELLCSISSGLKQDLEEIIKLMTAAQSKKREKIS